MRECRVWVYSKIYSRELEYTFKGIKANFNAKAAIRKLKIVIGDSQIPFLSLNSSFTDTFVEIQSDTLFYMLPKQIISYIYGCSDNGLHVLTYSIKKLHNNKLEVKIQEPSIF